MSKLVIVESPSKAKTIKKYLGSGYDVAASVGHVRDLPAAKLSIDVKNDFAPKYSVIKGKEKFVKELKQKAEKSDKVFLATDPDREGEAISWHIAVLLGLDPNEKNRITFNEITKNGVAAGMKSPRTLDMNLVNAQQARRILDRLVGYSLSPFISQKIRRGLSAGRVQSVAVKLIVDRDAEIEAFVPEEYWTIGAKLLTPEKKEFTAQLQGDETGKVKLTRKEQADAFLARLEGARYVVDGVKKGTKKRSPAPPFITSTLQQEASRRLGFQAQRTMKAAQELYEGVDIEGTGLTGLITYMRTDSFRVSDEARALGAEYIAQHFGGGYLPEKPRFYKSRASAQEGHEAIRPTLPSLTPEQVKSSLSADQYKLYSLIWKRFLASLMADCVLNTVKAEIKAFRPEDEKAGKFCLFTATGFSVRFDGFTKLYEEMADDSLKAEGNLPELKEKDNLSLKKLEAEKHFTQPPPRFTEASLIKALEENGVGRPSTYAAIISTIIKRDYVKRSAKLLMSTELGAATTKLLDERFPNIVNVKFTAEMETSLDEVGQGNEDYIKTLHAFYDDFDKTLKIAKEATKGKKILLNEDITDIACDKCGKTMIIKTGRYGRFLACSGYPDCSNTKPFPHPTKAQCPKCGANIIEKRSKKGFTFFGCEAWPNCDFATWDKPTAELCPQCGKSLFMKSFRLRLCLNEGCGYEIKVSKKSGIHDESREEQ